MGHILYKSSFQFVILDRFGFCIPHPDQVFAQKKIKQDTGQ
jgi:hypothetical protein